MFLNTSVTQNDCRGHRIIKLAFIYCRLPTLPSPSEKTGRESRTEQKQLHSLTPSLTAGPLWLDPSCSLVEMLRRKGALRRQEPRCGFPCSAAPLLKIPRPCP